MKGKGLFFLLAVIASSTSVYSQDNDLARVKKVNGVEVYVMCEPLRDYETIVDVSAGVNGQSLLTAGLVNKTISGRVEKFITRAKKENEDIDAIVYTSGKRVVGIKFKDGGTETTKGIGRVSKMKGLPVFVMCEPLTAYAVLDSKGGGVKWKSAVTAGLVNNSIEDDVAKIVDKLVEVKEVGAFYFDGTKEGDAIGFKQ